MSAPSSDLIPILSVCSQNECTEFVFTDITGNYSVGNPGGWNSLNKSASDVTVATVLITFPNGTTQTIDLLADIPDPIVGSFEYPAVTAYTTDGIYSFLYTITVDGETFTHSSYKLFLCKVKCCIDKLWAEVPAKMCSECEIEAYVSRVLFAQGLYQSLISMGACAQTTAITKVLTQLQKLCNFEDCNC